MCVPGLCTAAVMGNRHSSLSLAFRCCMWRVQVKHSQHKTHKTHTRTHTRHTPPGANDANSLITLARCSAQVQIGRDTKKSGMGNIKEKRKESGHYSLRSCNCFCKWNTNCPTSVYIHTRRPRPSGKVRLPLIYMCIICDRIK